MVKKHQANRDLSVHLTKSSCKERGIGIFITKLTNKAGIASVQEYSNHKNNKTSVNVTR